MNQNKVLKEFIEDLKWFAKEKHTIEQGKKYVFNHKGFKHIHIRTYHDLQNSLFFRVRSLDKCDDETQIKSHKYPPIEFNKIGRCNLKSKQVLYAANDPITAIYEYLNTGNSGDYIHISAWKLKANVSIPTFNIMKNPNHDTYTDDATGLKVNYSNELLNEMFDLLIKLYNQSKTYEFSAPFSHFLLYKIDICKMIRYPSVTTNAISNCVAINIDFFDQYFYLDKVYKIQVLNKLSPRELEGKTIQGVQISGLEVGNVLGDSIIYTNPDQKDLEFWDYYRLQGNEKDGYKFLTEK